MNVESKHRYAAVFRSFGVVLAAIALALSTNLSLAKDVKTLELGSKAPDFKLPGVDGKEYTLASFAEAKLLVVLFTCNHCPTAQAYEQRVIDFCGKYRPLGVELVAISPNSAEAVRLDELGYSDLGDSLDDMKICAKDRGFNFPYLYDGETQKASTEYGVLATPHAYVFDQERVLRYVGRIDDAEVKEPKSHDLINAVDELLAGKPVSTPKTRVFGCSTKWADKIESAEKAVAKWNQEEVDLKVVKPDELKKKLTSKSENYRLVNVWATWCIPCVEELEEFTTLHRMYRNRHFELITVSADELSAMKAAKKVLASKHLSASNFILDADSRDELFEAVDPEWEGAVPYTCLISPEGKVVFRKHDVIDPLELKREIVNRIGRTYADRK
ncbi:MAG: redoxin domain-containing protein [Pirellulaceae bacterium]